MSEDEQLDLVVINGTIVLGGGRYRIGVGVKNGKVAVLAPEEMMPKAKETIDAKGNFILPGIVDSEAHPGCYVPFEYDMKTESKAAACAGITTWGIQAPTTRLGTKPFKEIVSKSDVVSFNLLFPFFVVLVLAESVFLEESISYGGFARTFQAQENNALEVTCIHHSKILY